MERNKVNASFNRTSLLWISFTRFGVDLHSNSVLNIASEIQELGNDVSLIAVQSKDNLQYREGQLRLISIPLKGHQSITPIIFTTYLSLVLPIYIAYYKIEVIVIEPFIDVFCIIPQLIISKFKKLKIILDIRTVPVETVGFRGFLRHFWFNISINLAKHFFDGITIITPLMRKDICSSFKIDPKTVGTWSSGVDTKLFDPAKSFNEGKELKKRLGLSNKFIVFYHGVLTATRGLEITIESINSLKKKYPDVVLLLLGAGPIESRLKSLINSKQLQNNVVIHGPVDQLDVPKFISMSDVCIVPLPNHPYWRSQSPLKLLEYLSMEKIVILSDIPAHRLIIGEAQCGIFLSSVTSEEISKTIEYVYLNHDSLREYSKMGRQIVEKEFTWPKIALELENYVLFLKNNGKRLRLKQK
jgi:glycosyltransferase involved in cell wall biosynthesis